MIVMGFVDATYTAFKVDLIGPIMHPGGPTPPCLRWCDAYSEASSGVNIRTYKPLKLRQYSSLVIVILIRLTGFRKLEGSKSLLNMLANIEELLSLERHCGPSLCNFFSGERARGKILCMIARFYLPDFVAGVGACHICIAAWSQHLGLELLDGHYCRSEPPCNTLNGHIWASPFAIKL